ncbi:MAG: hypothetical protein M0Z96_06930 [Actinomycetota bacterium]|nr:hypothetical protein [Actinomycetota bacterium]
MTGPGGMFDIVVNGNCDDSDIDKARDVVLAENVVANVAILRKGLLELRNALPRIVNTWKVLSAL